MTVEGMTPQELVERALSIARSDGCIAIADHYTEANLRWANNTLTTNGVARSERLTVIAIVDGATGVVSREGVTAESLEDLVRAAEQTATEAPKAEDQAPLIGAEASSGDWEAPPADTSIQVFADFAPALGECFEQAHASGDLLFGYANHEMWTTYVGSSSGLRARHDQPTGHAEINAKSPDFTRSSWAGTPTNDFRNLDLHSITADLSQRLKWSERIIELPPGRYETILPATAVADLMISVYWSSDGRDAHDGRTVFSKPGGGTRIGERLTDTAVSLRSEPAASSIQCVPFVLAHSSSSALSVFDNGATLQPTDWISGGSLASLVQTRHSSQLTSLPFTPYIDNLILDGPAASAGTLQDLVARTERGLLLTCLWYIREVDPQTLLLTGLTRDGVYLVEGGEVTGAVNNFRFNESPVDMLARIQEAGDSARTMPREWSDYFMRTSMPALRVADFNMSSVSKAF